MLTHFFRRKKVLSIPELIFTVNMYMGDDAESTCFKRKYERVKAAIVKYGLPDRYSIYEVRPNGVYRRRWKLGGKWIVRILALISLGGAVRL